MLVFKDLADNSTSEDVEFSYKDNWASRKIKAGGSNRSVAKRMKDGKIASRMKDLSIIKELPETGAIREKVEEMADFLQMAKEDRDMRKRGEQVMRKLVQTRKVKSQKKNSLIKLVASCFDDDLLNETLDNATLQSTFALKIVKLEFLKPVEVVVKPLVLALPLGLLCVPHCLGSARILYGVVGHVEQVLQSLRNVVVVDRGGN
jgi:hypothetical protein